MSRCQAVIVADDLTGAQDAAAPFAARGATTEVVIALEHLASRLAAWQSAPPAVVAVNTQSRHLAPEAAAERVASAVRRLAPLAPAVWFKKLDSTLRGAVVAECLAMRRVLGCSLLLAPAVPAQGRIVRNAAVWVDEAPLADTAYGRDARSAPPLGPLDRLFADRGAPLVRYRPGGGRRLPRGDCVADAESEADLACLYDAALADGRPRLLAGAAGLATVVAQRGFGRLQAPPALPHGLRRHLFALGSRSPRAGEQLLRLRAADPAMVVAEALGRGSAARGPVTVVVPGDATVVGHDPERVALAMAEQVAAAMAAWTSEKGLLFLTGGDIAMAVLQRLGVMSIAVQGEWAPGVALGWLDGEPERCVITKAGGFGDPELLARLHQVLGRQPGPGTEARMASR